jgi:hypothetical protein
MDNSETVTRRNELRAIAQAAVTEALGSDVCGFQMVDAKPLAETFHVELLSDHEHDLLTLWRACMERGMDDRSVATAVLQTIDPLSAAGPEEETMLACLRQITPTHRYQLLHCALGFALMRRDGLDESLADVHWATNVDGPRASASGGAVVGCFIRAGEQLDRGEYLIPK